jgi:chromosome segregation ATPase
MTSEVEHDILVGAEGAWSHAAAGTAAGQPPAGAAATSEALAAAEAAAAAARAALSSAQAQIEELLDDKADLEYEVDVVERKVELLREEVRWCIGVGWSCRAL